MATAMTYDEAVNQVLGFRERVGRMPTHEDYQKPEHGLDLAELAKALKVNPAAEMKRLGVRPFAVVNIEVVHEDRRRNGRVVNIAEANDESSWATTQGNLFENRIDNE